MDARSLKDGFWCNIEDKAQFTITLTYGLTHYGDFARVQRGEYKGPGRYLLLTYSIRCPRNCCYDLVREFVHPSDVITEVCDEMQELAKILKTARISKGA